MKKIIIVILITLFFASGCSKKDVELIAICNTENRRVEVYNNIDNKVTIELYGKNDKLIKMVVTETYTSPTYEEYKESNAIDYNRQVYNSKKNTNGIQYEYIDDYTNLISTYKVTYIISKMTYAEKDDMEYQSMLDEYGEMMPFKKIVELYENDDLKCETKVMK